MAMAEGILDAADDLSCDVLVVQDEQLSSAGVVDSARRRGMSCVGPTRSQSALEADGDALRNVVGAGLPLSGPRVVIGTPGRLRRHIAARGTVVVRPAAAHPHLAAVVATVERDEAALSMLAAHGRVCVEPFWPGPVYTAYAAPDAGGSVVWSPTLRSFPFLPADPPVKTGGMGTHLVEIDVPSRWPTLDTWMAALLRAGGPKQWKTFVGVEVVDSPTGPVVVDLDCQLGNPETSALLAGFKGSLVDLLTAVAHGGRPSWGETSPAVSAALAIPGYPGADATLIETIDVEPLEAAGLRVDLGSYQPVGRRAVAGPSHPAVISATGRTTKDALARLRSALPSLPRGLVMSDAVAGVDHPEVLDGAVEAQLLDEIEQVVVAPVRALLGEAVGDSLSVSASLAVHAIARSVAGLDETTRADDVFHTLWPDGQAPTLWWATPLGQAVRSSARHLDRYPVSISVAGEILAVSRARLYQLIEDGGLTRHPAGGVTLGSVLARRPPP